MSDLGVINPLLLGGASPCTPTKSCAEAKMRDEMTGKRLFRDDEIPQNVTALATWIHNDVLYSLGSYRPIGLISRQVTPFME